MDSAAASDRSPPKHPQQLFFDNVSPATRLLEKRRQMYEVQDALENQKTRFAKDEEQFKQKEEQLRKKDLNLQHQLFRFNKFLQDNEAKRRRAETRAAEEAAQIRQKDEEIADLERQLEESKQHCLELEDEVSKNMKYEEFLERVKDSCDEYSQIEELVTRYETLEGANKDLVELQTASDKRIEELRNECRDYGKQQEMEHLELTNRYSQLSIQLDEEMKEKARLEHMVDEATQEDSKHSLHFGQILMSVENLYLRCTAKRRNIQHSITPADDDGSKKDAEGKDEAEDSFFRKQQNSIRHLKVILAYLKDFKDIVEQLKKERKAAQTTAKLHVTTEAAKPPEPKFHYEAEKGGERASHSTGSQGNTRDLSQGKTGSVGADAGASKGD